MKAHQLLPLIIIIALFVFYGCQNDRSIITPENDTNTPQDSIPEDETDVIPDTIPDNEIITIPVVVHVVNYEPDTFTISDEKIRSQIEVLNQDFRKKNEDWQKTPEEFIDLVADVGIEFKLAVVDPEGNETTGITRTMSEVSGWHGTSIDDVPVEDQALYFSSMGGHDAWSKDHYLNIWVADLSDRWGNLGIAGYANLPGCDPRMDGVVMDPRVFGILPPLEPHYEFGRTATHEIGHWLNLRHIYGKDGSCEDGDDGDLVEDTPIQSSQYLGNPVHPASSCSTHDMFMNFMDRVHDKSMYMFTKGQRRRIRDIFNKGGARRELYLNSVCK